MEGQWRGGQKRGDMIPREVRGTYRILFLGYDTRRELLGYLIFVQAKLKEERESRTHGLNNRSARRKLERMHVYYGTVYAILL